MKNITQQKNWIKKPIVKNQDYRNSIRIRAQRLDPDILSFIKNGFLKIPVPNFSKMYSDSIRNKFEFRARLIDWFIFADAKKFQNANLEIKVSIFSVTFDEEKDEFYVGATINKPTKWELFLLVELMRDSALEASDLHGIELSARAARQVMNDLNCNEVLVYSSDVCH